MGKQDKQPKRTLDGWSRTSLVKDSPAYNRYVEQLNQQVKDAQFDMIHFADNMEEWSNPKSAEGKARQFNDTYCECMINMCLEPLQQGLDGDAVIQSIGMFVGMSVLSKDFRQKCNLKAANALMPHVKNAAMNAAEMADKISGSSAKIGADMGINGTSDKVSYQERMEQKVSERWDKIRQANNGGRPYFTPEAAATKYLGFCKQAYFMMRIDTPEMQETRKSLAEAKANQEISRAERLQASLERMEKERNQRVMSQFGRASESLKAVAEMDGVTADEFTRAVHKVYGSVSEKYPEMERMFDQTAFGKVDKVYTYEMDPKTKQQKQIWTGDLGYEDGSRFTELLTPRPPMTRKECAAGVRDAYLYLYEPCQTVDEINWMHEQKPFQQMSPYLTNILKDDLTTSWTAEKPGMTLDDYLESVIAAGHEEACQRWVDERTEPEKELRKQQEAEAKEARQRKRDEYAAAREEREQRDDARKQSKYEAEMKKNEAELESIQKGGYTVNIILPNGMSPSSKKWMARQAKRSLTPKPEEHEGVTEDTDLDSDKDSDLSK